MARDIPNWLVPAVAAVAALYLYRRVGNIGAGAAKAAQETGEKISSSLFDFLNPALRPENYNRPTIVNAQMVGGKYVCPKGYRYKLTARNEHLCFRED